MLIGQPAEGAKGPVGDVIKDTDTANFMADVVDASKETPVIVDFWAPWCGPCKQLTPLLEKLVKQYAGKVRMVKINVDENQQLAQQFRVQSIPAVYGFRDGQPVDGFMGALPESQLKQFFDRLTGNQGSMIDEALQHAETLVAEGQPDQALMVYQEILEQEPTHVKALAGALRLYVSLGQPDAAREALAQLPDNVKNATEIKSVQAMLDVQAATANAGDAGAIAALESKVAADPKDMQSRFDLAMARYGAGDREQALDHLLDIVKRDRKWNEEAARKQLVQFFEALGPMDPLTIQGRRKLSSILFS